MTNRQEILVVAGEISGDLHAAPVVAELKTRYPDLHLFGAGGDRMRSADVELLATADELAVMGFSDVPRVLPRLSRLKKAILRRVSERNIRLAILVDYPGFNLNLAKALKRLPNPPRILYYIAPQAWAWRPGRTKLMRQVIDMLAVVFPFEVDFFSTAGVPVTFVGHPLVDELGDILDKSSDTDHQQPHKNRNLLAILPGSRRQVIDRHLPIMVKSARLLRQRVKDLEAAVGCAPGIEEQIYLDAVEDEPWITLSSDSRELIHKANAAVVSSGTVTLEAALLNTPQVAVYRTTSFNYHIIKHLIHIDRVTLVNVVAGYEVIPELLQRDFTTQKVSDAAMTLFADEAARRKISEGYTLVRSKLGEGKAAQRVADIASDFLK